LSSNRPQVFYSYCQQMTNDEVKCKQFPGRAKTPGPSNGTTSDVVIGEPLKQGGLVSVVAYL